MREPLHISRSPRELGQVDQWNEDAIKERAASLAEKALQIWTSPRLPDDVLARYRPKITATTNYTLADHPHLVAPAMAHVFDLFRKEVLALDMFSAFEPNLLDPRVGMRFRREILEQGGQAEAMTLVKRFLGREPSSEAFFAEITGKR